MKPPDETPETNTYAGSTGVPPNRSVAKAEAPRIMSGGARARDESWRAP
jgi:hypothetical protein